MPEEKIKEGNEGEGKPKKKTHAYTPGLEASKEAIVKRARRLPIKGEVIVKKGDRIKADDVVAKAHLPGNVVLDNLGNKAGIPAEDLQYHMLKKQGDSVTEGEVIFRMKTFFGLFKKEIKAPTTGIIETISNVTGQMVYREPPIPIEVKAYIDGIVEEVFEENGVLVKTPATFIQGIFGIGGERNGELILTGKGSDYILKAEDIKEDYKGKILIGGAQTNLEALRKANSLGVKGIIVGGIRSHDLVEFLGYNIGVAVTGNEKINTTLILTEGFGKMTMTDKTYELLKENAGKKASINGATQIRAGVIRPEIVIPLEYEVSKTKTEEEMGLTIGSLVRGIRNPYFGKIGKVTGMPKELQTLESEATVRILELEFEAGKKVIVPRANVEIIKY